MASSARSRPVRSPSRPQSLSDYALTTNPSTKPQNQPTSSSPSPESYPFPRIASTSNSTSTGSTPRPQPRQTKISQHLKSTKPSTPSPKLLASKPVAPSTSRPTLYPSEPSRLSRLPEDRKVSGGTRAAEVAKMAQDEVEKRLREEKDELMGRLQEQGLTPNPDDLDRALRTINGPISPSTDEEAALHSFLAALSSPERATLRSASPPSLPASGDIASASSALRLSTSISIADSQPLSSNPSNPVSSPPRSASKPLTNRTQSLAPAFEPVPRSIRRTMSVGGKTLPASFARKTSGPLVAIQSPMPSAPSLHDEPAPPPTRPSVSTRTSLIAASVEGMGRVALRADVLVASLGPEPAVQAIAAAATPTLGLPFGHIAGNKAEQRMAQNRTLFADVFGVDAAALQAKRPSPARARSPHPSMSRNKLERVQAWLNSPDASGPEDEGEASGARAGWNSIPKAWERDSAALAKAKQLARSESHEVRYVDVSDESEEDEPRRPEVRVGGKNIRMLVNTKRRRSENHEPKPVDPAVYKSIYKDPTPAKTPRKVSAKAAALSTSPVPPPKGRGKSIVPTPVKPSATDAAAEEDEDVIDCVCGRQEEGDEGMIQCDACQCWLHLVCVGFGHRQRFPRVWTCSRCVEKREDEASPTKRARQTTPAPEEFVPVRALTPEPEDDEVDEGEVAAGREREATPVHNGPVLVPTSASRAEPSYLNASTMTLALAPSPTASPIRYAVPRSPVSSRRHRQTSAADTPITALLSSSPVRGGDLGEPSSPLYHRGGRIRMISSVVNDPPSDVLAAGWSAGWDSHASYGLDSHERTRAGPVDEDDLLGVSRTSSWHDLNMTPSRTLGASPMAYMPSPSTGRRSRQVSGAHAAFGTSSAQDFLSSLHSDEPSTHAVAQRLFGGPSPSRPSEAALLSSPGNYAHVSSSPASARRSVGMGKRVLSGGGADWATGSAGLERGREVFASPSARMGAVSRGGSPSPVGRGW